MEIRENFNLRSYNTFNIESRCKYFVESDKATEFLSFAADYELNPQETLLLGGGSNLLFTEDFEGTVLHPVMKGIEVVGEKGDDVFVRAGAGVVWDDFVAWSTAEGLNGIENLSGIPGRVGASPVQNVGAYGMEAGSTIQSVEAVDLKEGSMVTIDATKCEFAYRDSMFKHTKNRYLVTAVTYRLSRVPNFRLDYGSIRTELERLSLSPSAANVRTAVLNIRASKLPDVTKLPNAGSFFKNPIVENYIADELRTKYPTMPIYPANETHKKLAAGWLIEQAGWKGRSLGNAGVHEHQALVLVNLGNASGLEITRLANEVKKAVFLKFNVWIEPEVNIL